MRSLLKLKELRKERSALRCNLLPPKEHDKSLRHSIIKGKQLDDNIDNQVSNSPHHIKCQTALETNRSIFLNSIL